MLRNFRGFFKGQQTPMTVVMVVLAVGMLAYLAPSGGSDYSQGSTAIARVYGREITINDLARAVDNLENRMGKQGDTASRRAMLQGQALNGLIADRLWQELAERHNVVVTDEEVRQSLTSMFQSAPGFTHPDGTLKSPEEIEELLLSNRSNPMTLKTLEREQRRQLITSKVRSQAAAQVHVDEPLLATEYRVRNEKLTVEMVHASIDTSAIKDPGDAALQTFMTAGGARFQVGPRRVVQWTSVDRAFFGKSLEPDAKSLQATYESKKAAYTEQKALHILIKGKTPDELAAAQAKLATIQEKLKAGADFSKLADEFSEDPSVKENHGLMDWFAQGRMVKPFWDGAMGLKAGEVSGPVKTEFGLHLIKLVDRRVKPFEEVQETLKTQMIQDRFATRAKEKLEDLRKRAGQGDIAKAAQALGLKVQNSKPLLNEPDSTIEGLDNGNMIAAEAFYMKVGEVSKVQPMGDRFVVFRVAEEKPATIPPMAEIRAKVLAAYQLEEARKALQARATQALAKGGLTALGTPVTETDKAISDLAEAAQQPMMRKALLETKEGSLTPACWTSDGRLWVAKVVARKPAVPMTFATRQSLVRTIQESTAERLLMGELQSLYTYGKAHANLSSLRGRLSGIWIDEAFLNKQKADAERQAD